jgi:hypothetical protein
MKFSRCRLAVGSKGGVTHHLLGVVTSQCYYYTCNQKSEQNDKKS